MPHTKLDYLKRISFTCLFLELFRSLIFSFYFFLLVNLDWVYVLKTLRSLLYHAGCQLFCGDAMDAKAAQRLQFSTLIHCEKIGRKLSGSVKFSRVFEEPQKLRICVLQPATARPSRNRGRAAPLEVSCSYDNLPGCCNKHFILKTIWLSQFFPNVLFIVWSNQYLDSVVLLLFYYWLPLLLLHSDISYSRN